MPSSASDTTATDDRSRTTSTMAQQPTPVPIHDDYVDSSIIIINNSHHQHNEDNNTTACHSNNDHPHLKRKKKDRRQPFYIEEESRGEDDACDDTDERRKEDDYDDIDLEEQERLLLTREQKKEHGQSPPNAIEKITSVTQQHMKRNSARAKTTEGYVVLSSAVIALSAIGPLLDIQGGVVHSTMKILWRTTATALILTPYTIYSFATKGFPRLSSLQWFRLWIAGTAQVGMTIFFATAVTQTAIGNAVVLGNSQSLILLVGQILMGQPVSRMKCGGALLAFFGAILCSKEDSDEHLHQPIGMNAPTEANTLLGDINALCSALCCAAYLVTAKSVRQTMDLYVFLFFIMLFGVLQTLFYLHLPTLSIDAYEDPISWNMNEHHGIFGWVRMDSWDRLPLEIVMVLICNFLGTLGYIRSMSYFDNLTIGVAALMEPVTADLMAVAFNVGHMPGPLAWMGNLLVAIGTYTVIAQEKKK